MTSLKFIILFSIVRILCSVLYTLANCFTYHVDVVFLRVGLPVKAGRSVPW